MNQETVSNFLSKRSVTIVALALLGLMLIVLLVQTYGRAYRDVGYDFTSYLLSAKALMHGENPFETDTPFRYIYPMFFAFILIPLSLVPYWLSNLLWYLINVASMLGSIIIFVRLSSRDLKTAGGGELYAPIVLVLLLLTSVLQNHLLNGQVNFVVLLFCALFFKFDSEDRPVPAAAFLALAAAIKLVPLIFFMFLILRRRFKTLAFSTLLLVAFFLLPVITLGGDLFAIYGEYIRSFILGKFSGVTAHDTGQIYFTLSGLVGNLVPALQSWSGLKMVSALVIVAAVGIVDLVSSRKRGPESAVWVFNLYLLAILLITPLSEKHHLAYLIPAVSILFIKLLYDRDVRILPSGILLGAFFVFFYLGNGFGGPFYFLAVLALFGATARMAPHRIVAS